MTLTAAEVGSLTKAIDLWEYAEYACTALVAIACFGEYIADFTEWWRSERFWMWFGAIKHRKDKVAKASTLVLIFALAGELLCVVITNQLSGKLVGSLGDRADEAFTKSGDALNKAKAAILQADSATQQSRASLEQATDASRSATSAVNVAREARKEADSFEKDIAASRLALEKQKEEMLSQGPRWFVISKLTPQLIEDLKPFKGQHCFVASCNNTFPYDTELEQTLVTLVAALKKSEWNVSSQSYGGCLNSGVPPAMIVTVHTLASENTSHAADVLANRLLRAVNAGKFPVVAFHSDLRPTQMPDGSVQILIPWYKPIIEHFRDAISIFVAKHP